MFYHYPVKSLHTYLIIMNVIFILGFDDLFEQITSKPRLGANVY